MVMNGKLQYQIERKEKGVLSVVGDNYLKDIMTLQLVIRCL